MEQWAEGPLEGKVRDITVGYLLYNILGSKSTSTNADASGNVKDHQFDVNNTNLPPTLTFARKDPQSDRRHGLGALDNLDITCEAGAWAMLSGNVKAKAGTSVSNTVALANEYEFTSKHITTKLASSVAGLGAATALKVKSMRLSIERPATLFFPHGQVDPSDVTTGSIRVSGELVLQYSDTTLEDLWFANTLRAMSITLKNTDATIGTAANPTLAFTMPRVRLNTFTTSDDLDGVVEQTVGFTAELDLTAGYMIRAVLTNLKSSY